MSLPKTLGAYSDVDKVLRTALAAGGATVNFATPGKAIRFTQRAYYYRKLLLNTDALMPAVVSGARLARTPYDTMVLRKNDTTVEIVFDASPEIVSITDQNGNALDLTSEPADAIDEADDELISEARRAILDLKTDG